MALLVALNAGAFMPLAAFAEDGQDDVGEEVYYDDSADAEDADLVSEEEGEVVVQAVEVSDLEVTAVEEFKAASKEEGAVTSFLLSVRWGYFLDEGEERPDLEVTDWDGTVSFDNGTFALPLKALRFEKDSDRIDFDNTFVHFTTFESDIYNGTDGLLFKVKSNLGANPDNGIPFVAFASETSEGGDVKLTDLLELGEYVITDGDYSIAFKVWTPEEWIAGQAEAQKDEMEQGVTDDAEKGSWYEHFMNSSVQNGFFGGDRHANGRPTGTIRPGDGITRFELLKVASMLAFRLEMGVGATECNPKDESSTTSWMGEHWADGIIYCLEQSGLKVRLLDEIIAQDVSVGSQPAGRLEVVVTLLEVLGIDPTSSDAALFTDSDEMSDEEQDHVNYLSELGVVGGYPDGHFGTGPVNRAEMFKIVSLLYEALSL